MKNTLYIILMIIGVKSVSTAQSSHGFHFGINYANVTENREFFINGVEEFYKPILGFQLGYTQRILFNSTFGLTSDIRYSLRGSKWPGFKHNAKYGYLQLSPKLDILMTENLGLGIGTYGSMKQFENDNLSVIKKWDFGFVGTLGYSFNNILVRAGYELGILVISDFFFTDENGNSIGNANQKNRNIYLSMTYLFGENERNREDYPDEEE